MKNILKKIVNILTLQNQTQLFYLSFSLFVKYIVGTIYNHLHYQAKKVVEKGEKT